MRQYRHEIVSKGQASPPRLARFVERIVKNKLGHQGGLSVLDVGCGTGTQMAYLMKLAPSRFTSVVGLDWSPATVEYGRRAGIYNQVVLADSASLPFESGHFDLALSMENLEHLYDSKSTDSIREMARVAKAVVLTTPLPGKCIDFNFLNKEIFDAINDKVPLNLHDYICLESAIHKSTLFPASLLEAGFHMLRVDHGVYFARSDEIDFSKIECVGIDDFPVASQKENIENLGQRYVKLLAQSAKLHETILMHPRYEVYRPSLLEVVRRSTYSLASTILPRRVKAVLKGHSGRSG